MSGNKQFKKVGNKPVEIEGKICMGQIVNAQGLRGEVKVYSYADDNDLFFDIPKLFLQAKGKNPKAEAFLGYHDIEKVWFKGITPIIKLKGLDDRNAAEDVKFVYVYMDESDLPELEEGEFYVKDIVGFEVVTEDGTLLGHLKDIATNTPQYLYLVTPVGGDPDDEMSQIMIPGVDEFILETNPEKKQILVRIPEGLLDL